MRQVINKLDEIDFHDQKERHLFNDIYERFCAICRARQCGRVLHTACGDAVHGRYGRSAVGATVLDPACGTGGFLVCAGTHESPGKDADDLAVVEQSLMGVEEAATARVVSDQSVCARGQRAGCGARQCADASAVSQL